jgi:two-component system chemotaxis response regulator CheB
MPALFTRPLAQSLAAQSRLCVKEAADRETALANCVYIAPGGSQMKLAPGKSSEITIGITDDPPENNCKPAADYLFRSAALQFPGRAVAVILTGMGNDGTAGLRMLKRRGCFAIAQDETSCVVFGMPKEAISTGLVDAVEPLDRIGEAIVRSVRGLRV